MQDHIAFDFSKTPAGKQVHQIQFKYRLDHQKNCTGGDALNEKSTESLYTYCTVPNAVQLFSFGHVYQM
jgi:hypothetical protein